MNFPRTVCLLVLTLLLVPAVGLAQDWGEIREATQNLNVRSQPNKDGEHVLTLAKGQRVKADFLKDGWVAVFNLNETQQDLTKAVGYANARFLKIVPDAVANTPEPEANVESAAVPEAKVVVADSGEGEVKAPVAATPPADPIKVGIDPSRIPVKITSDRMTYDESGKVVAFVGNVVAVHGELTLWADNISAYLSSKENKKFSADSVDRVIAQGNVRAKKGTTEGSCGKLTYFVVTQTLKMEQSPLLVDGPNSLTGEVINFHIKDNRSEVIGGSEKRVKAIFMTPDNLKVK
ncbi:LPS ABC transporter substrate-binding protein LptA [Pseudodesulfovibrio sp. S3]|nr:LPS ABC transporter substrate-binding protein LptA [Pseudodesulfovibrio sp. S3]